jgi:alpha-L-fucosidase
MLPPDRVFSKDRYTACPAIRHLSDGLYYMVYLEALAGPVYSTYVVRSPDLVHWELSPLNPVLEFSDEDKQIANPRLTADERERIAAAVNRNNSDMDLCEFQGRTIINYSWGSQLGNEFLAEAVYEGPLETFLRGFFP